MGKSGIRMAARVRCLISITQILHPVKLQSQNDDEKSVALEIEYRTGQGVGQCWMRVGDLLGNSTRIFQ